MTTFEMGCLIGAIIGFWGAYKALLTRQNDGTSFVRNVAGVIVSTLFSALMFGGIAYLLERLLS